MPAEEPAPALDVRQRRDQPSLWRQVWKRLLELSVWAYALYALERMVAGDPGGLPGPGHDPLLGAATLLCVFLGVFARTESSRRLGVPIGGQLACLAVLLVLLVRSSRELSSDVAYAWLWTLGIVVPTACGDGVGWLLRQARDRFAPPGRRAAGADRRPSAR